MRTLDFGYQLPEDEDSGEEFFPALARNVEKLSLFTSYTQDLLAADWVSQGNGVYRQLVTLPTELSTNPGSFTFDTLSMQFRLSTGEIVQPTVEKVSSKTFYVYTNDNSVVYRILYSS
jgi:hypothetical protein